MATPMNYRSTSAIGFVHFGGDVVSGVQHGRGVQLGSADTGSIPAITPVGDDTAISLIIKAKGSGGVYIGSTGSSASGIKGIYTKTSTWSSTEISSGQIAELTFASTTFDVDVGDLVSVAFVDLAAPVVSGGFRLSTASASRLTVILTAPGSSKSSTLSGSIVVSYVDVT